jgi:hypothetical protein
VPDNAFSLVVREPVGVVGQIIPWNYPILMAAWKLAPALAAGCTVVLKPAEQTPLSALLLGEIFQSLDLPSGVVNIVTGDEIAGAALVADARIDKIAFTGSVEVGKVIVRGCADGMKRMSMELGGKNPNIVFADADFEQAVDGALFGAFANQGEVCSAGSRLLVERSIYDELVDALQQKINRVVLGDPMKRETKMGPLVTVEHTDKVLRYIDEGRREGRLVTGGSRANVAGLPNGNFTADYLRRRETGRPNRPRGDLRSSAVGSAVHNRGRSDSPRQRHAVRPGRRRVDTRRLSRHPRAQADSRRDPLAQHLPPDLQRGALGRLQAVRVRTGTRIARHRALPRDQADQHQPH